ITGRGIPVPGNDIDTDRIIPARFLKEVTFETMGQHAFEDARKQNPEHPFNSPAYQGASVLVVGQNFGCGSAGACASGADAVGYCGNRWRVVWRDLLRELHDARDSVPAGVTGGSRVAAAGDRAGAAGASGGGCGEARGEVRQPDDQGDDPG